MNAIKMTLVLLFIFATHSASPFSISFDQNIYSADIGSQVTVKVNYDFTDQTVVSFGADLHYDPSVLEFVSYVPVSSGPPITTVIGSWVKPGLYKNFGLGTEFFNGISNAAILGTFTFTVIGDVATPGTVCGYDLCLTSTEFLPVVSIAGQDITDMVFAGQGGLSADVTQVPVPAGIWMLLSAFGLMMSVSKK